MPDARTRAGSILKALPLSTRQGDLYERGVDAMDEATLELTTSRFESALSEAPTVLGSARELLASQQREAATIPLDSQQVTPLGTTAHPVSGSRLRADAEHEA